MAHFNVRTTGIDIFVFILQLASLMVLVAIPIIYFLGLSHYTFITNSNPPGGCGSIPTATDFRPAASVPIYSGLPLEMQCQILYYGWNYFVLMTDLVRFLYPFVFLIYTNYIRQWTVAVIFVGLFVIFNIWEIIKFVILLLGIRDPNTYWYAFAPEAQSPNASLEFLIIFYTTIATIVYNVISIGAVLVLSMFSKNAIESEQSMGFSGSEFLQSQIGERIGIASRIGEKIGSMLGFVPVIRQRKINNSNTIGYYNSEIGVNNEDNTGPKRRKRVFRRAKHNSVT